MAVFGMALLPKILSGAERIDIEALPPGEFISSPMELPMVPPAEWYCELIADFEADSSRLRKA